MSEAGVWSRMRSAWTRFWHEPVRAERLAAMRILLAFAVLTDQLLQYWPNMEELFGPTGVAFEGLHDEWTLRRWKWTMLLFNSDDLQVVNTVFFVWVAATVMLLVGCWTRTANVIVWFLTLCFVNRNPNVLNGGDDVMKTGLLLLALAPSGRALSLDSWWRRRRAAAKGEPPPSRLVEPWSVRLLQIQLAVIYCSTGLVKLTARSPFYEGTWWAGTSIHYVLNDATMARWSYAQLPVPFWITAPMTYLSVWWEVLFPLLVLFRRTRGPALVFGVLFHFGIWLTIEVGWFSFYTLAFYGVWIPAWFWERWERTKPVTST